MKTPNLKRAAILARTHARRFLLQQLYQWQLSGDSPDIVQQQRFIPDRLRDLDEDYLQQGWQHITAHRDELDALIAPHLKRSLAALDPVEHAALWIGAFELTQRRDIHPTVVINEAVELAKQFGSDEGYKFVNGILDKIRRRLGGESG